LIISTILYALFGWLVGNIINHAANTLPKRQTVFQKPSCPECGMTHIYPAWSSLIAALTGHQKCTGCGQQHKSFIRSIIVELTTPLFFAFLLQRYSFSLQLGTTSLYTAILILITITDLEHRRILNIVIGPSILLAIIISFFTPLTGFWTFAYECNSLLWGIFTLYTPPPGSFWIVALIGGVIAFMISILAWLLAVLAYGHGALGQGDVTLSIFLGLILGFPYILLTFLFTVFLGSFVPFVLLVIRRVGLRSYIPYGPFLTITGWIMLIWGDEIWRYWYC
jgi:leader peptidase (prepilin peptidase)/N-methyltransferase